MKDQFLKSFLSLCILSFLTLEAEDKMKNFINSINMEFVYIPTGTFMMGSLNDDKNAYEIEKPQRRVSINKAFYLGKYEVTQAQWEKIMGFNPYKLERSNPFYSIPGMAKRLTKPNNPATVSWNDAQEFIKKLNELEKTNKYFLPSDTQWEYAARAGTTTAYSFGDDKSFLDEYAWNGEGFTFGSTHKVGTKKPNPWGLYDVHGNAWEWVDDWYKNDSSTNEKIVRGGSWHTTATSWRSAFKKGYDIDYRGISIGFRIAMKVQE
jgi:formylglycine-generating enzyme required for sulfatase activity